MSNISEATLKIGRIFGMHLKSLELGILKISQAIPKKMLNP